MTVIPSDLTALLVTARRKLKHADRSTRAWLDECGRNGDLVQAAQAPTWALYEKSTAEWRTALGALDAWLYDQEDRPGAPTAAEQEVTLDLDAYERDNLLWLINATQLTHNTGDWHGQIRGKLKPELGPGRPNESMHLDLLKQTQTECTELRAQLARMGEMLRIASLP